MGPRLPKQSGSVNKGFEVRHDTVETFLKYLEQSSNSDDTTKTMNGEATETEIM